MNLNRWELVFKTLSNINRLRIIRMLNKGRRMNVSEIAEQLGISFMATSRHLIILRNVEVLQSEGVEGRVIYSVNPNMPRGFKKIINTAY